MNIGELIAPDRIAAGCRAANKRNLLTDLAHQAGAVLQLDAQMLLALLTAREELGSTGVGHGVAIPHIRIEALDKFFGLFVRLDRPVNFVAIDGLPVDLVFLLLIPTEASSNHLAALACVLRRLRDPETARRLRATTDAASLYQILIEPSSAA